MFKFARMNDDSQIPTKGSSGSAGYDLYASHNAVIKSGERGLVKTGIAIQIPEYCYARVAPRSGLAFRNGINVGAGVVDSDYRNEIGVVLFNHDKDNDFHVHKGDRIAQLIFEKICETEPEVVDYSELTDTGRGTSGFGSTGV
jgi:deoxyuridine 5'-triphosphate nucleotidohydrolase